MLVVLGAIVTGAVLSALISVAANVGQPLLPVLLTVAASGWIAARMVSRR
jgi:hypothetical protein